MKSLTKERVSEWNRNRAVKKLITKNIDMIWIEREDAHISKKEIQAQGDYCSKIRFSKYQTSRHIEPVAI